MTRGEYIYASMTVLYDLNMDVHLCVLITIRFCVHIVQ